jgi:hypothetical protein
MVEVPDQVISALGNPGLAELQLKAVGIAKNATWKHRVKHWNLQFPSWLSSRDCSEDGIRKILRGR